SAVVEGVRYDVLDLAPDDPELQDPLYRLLGRWILRKQHPPPHVDLRGAWRERTGGDTALGLALGLLERDGDGRGLRTRYVVNRLQLEGRGGVDEGFVARDERGPRRRGADSDPRAAGQ